MTGGCYNCGAPDNPACTLELHWRMGQPIEMIVHLCEDCWRGWAVALKTRGQVGVAEEAPTPRRKKVKCRVIRSGPLEVLGYLHGYPVIEVDPLTTDPIIGDVTFYGNAKKNKG